MPPKDLVPEDSPEGPPSLLLHFFAISERGAVLETVRAMMTYVAQCSLCEVAGAGVEDIVEVNNDRARLLHPDALAMKDDAILKSHLEV